MITVIKTLIRGSGAYRMTKAESKIESNPRLSRIQD